MERIQLRDGVIYLAPDVYSEELNAWLKERGRKPIWQKTRQDYRKRAAEVCRRRAIANRVK